MLFIVDPLWVDGARVYECMGRSIQSMKQLASFAFATETPEKLRASQSMAMDAVLAGVRSTVTGLPPTKVLPPS